jgi:Protein of unknown function (DUF2510)
VTTAAQRRRDVLERARDRRRRLAAAREQQPLRRAMFLGGAIGLGVGVVLGALSGTRIGPVPRSSRSSPSSSERPSALGWALEHAHAGERRKAREEARARDEERARRRAEAQRERRARRVVAAPSLRGDDDFLVPPGFYPDPDGSDRRRWWDGVKWTSKRAA